MYEDKITSKHQPNGPIVDNKPFKITLKAGQFNSRKTKNSHQLECFKL